MSEMSMNPVAKKAVLILEGVDGSVVVATVYDPRFDAKFEEYSVGGSYVHSTVAETTLSFKGMKQAPFPATNEDLRQHAIQVYAVGRRDALANDVQNLTAWGNDAIAEMNQRAHEVGIEMAYLAGVQAGAQQVVFRDERVEKEIDQERLSALSQAYQAVNSLLIEFRYEKAEKGLKKARKAIDKLYSAANEAFQKRWDTQ